MKRSEAFPSRYLGKDDLPQPPGSMAATIQDVRMESIESDGRNVDKAVMYFASKEMKPLITNTTNFMACEEAYGDDSDNWAGKPIELYVDPGVMYAGKRVGGVRVRIPASTTKARPAPATSGPPPVDGPPAMVGDGTASTKKTAWQRCLRGNNEDPGKASAAWQTAMAKVLKSTGLAEQAFTGDDWNDVAVESELPFNLAPLAAWRWRGE